MPINRLLKEGNFTPIDAKRLEKAFALTLHDLGLVDRSDPVCDIVAQKVIEIGATGTHDPKEIAKLAVKQLGA
jgi:hypothetical protein